MTASTPPCRENVTALVLAGGSGSRLGGADKGLVELAGAPLIEHVAARLVPQVAGVLVSANRNVEVWRRYGWPVLTDPPPGGRGPLAGILAGLEACPTDWLLVVPCDAPALPQDLCQRLAAADPAHPLRIARTGGDWQPVFALLHRRLAADLRDFLGTPTDDETTAVTATPHPPAKTAEHKVMTWMARHAPRPVDWVEAKGFLNLNTPAELAAWSERLPPPPLRQAPLWVGRAPVLGIAAPSGTGKTTLLEAVLPHLVAAGLRVALVKHAHHDFDLDQPGKDSHRLRQAGARQVVVGSTRRLASIIEREDPECAPSLGEFLARIDPRLADLVLVEGFKRDPIPRLALARAGAPSPPVPLTDPWLVALVSDDPAGAPTTLPCLALDDPAAVAAFLVRWRRERLLAGLAVDRDPRPWPQPA
jgi:molybdopterin molybdotransferase